MRNIEDSILLKASILFEFKNGRSYSFQNVARNVWVREVKKVNKIDIVDSWIK